MHSHISSRFVCVWTIWIDVKLPYVNSHWDIARGFAGTLIRFPLGLQLQFTYCRGTWRAIRDHVQRSYLIVREAEPDQLCVPAPFFNCWTSCYNALFPSTLTSLSHWTHNSKNKLYWDAFSYAISLRTAAIWWYLSFIFRFALGRAEFFVIFASPLILFPWMHFFVTASFSSVNRKSAHWPFHLSLCRFYLHRYFLRQRRAVWELPPLHPGIPHHLPLLLFSPLVLQAVGFKHSVQGKDSTKSLQVCLLVPESDMVVPALRREHPTRVHRRLDKTSEFTLLNSNSST